METKDSTRISRGKDFGKFLFGCQHYKRRCKIRAPCCNLIFPCRHCHNDSAVPSLFIPLPKNKLRILYLILRNDMIWSAKTSNWLFVQYVKLSNRLLKSAPIAASLWGNTFAISANSLTTIPRNNNFIVMTVAFVELVGVTNSFIATTVELAMQRACAINTRALRTPQRILVLSVMSICSIR